MKGFKKLETNNNEFNSNIFLIKQLIGKIDTNIMVEVIAINGDYVDVKPLLNTLNGDLVGVEANIVYKMPYFTYQCGAKAVKITPVVGDWGVILCCKEDITKIKNTKQRANPNSLRKYNIADGLYIGSFVKKQEATEFIEITENSINITTTGDVNINATTNKINCDTEITGNLKVSGNIEAVGTITGSDCISGVISGLSHIHGGITPGGESTTPPQ